MKEPCIDCPDKVVDDYGYLCDIACQKRTAWLNYKVGYEEAREEMNLQLTSLADLLFKHQQAGMQVVVNWGEELCDCPKSKFPSDAHTPTIRRNCWKCWQVFLKERSLEVRKMAVKSYAYCTEPLMEQC